MTDNFILRERTFKNGTKHTEKICKDTGRHLGFVSVFEDKDWPMPYGKYKSMTLGHINQGDRPYLIWCAENFKDKRIKQRIQRFLDDNPKEPKLVQSANYAADDIPF